ncbi:MAG: putative peptidoglycan binding domain [Candidatus Parcubacteria bacterium]|jgi:hypothetical protein
MKKILVASLFLIFAFSQSVSAQQQQLLFPVDLHPGIKNEVAVLVLQKFLRAERYYDGPIFGIYDTATSRAVQKFQEKNFITPTDGIFKGKTRTKANSMIQSQLESYTSTSKNSGKEPVKKQPVKPAVPVVKKVAPPKDCFAAGNLIKHGQSRNMFRYEVAAQGGICHSETRSCADGFLDGDPGFRYLACKGATKMKMAPQKQVTNTNDAAKSMCIFGEDKAGKAIQLCAITATDGRCSNVQYPCAFIGPNNQKACFAKIDGTCPRVPKNSKK